MPVAMDAEAFIELELLRVMASLEPLGIKADSLCLLFRLPLNWESSTLDKESVSETGNKVKHNKDKKDGSICITKNFSICNISI